MESYAFELKGEREKRGTGEEGEDGVALENGTEELEEKTEKTGVEVLLAEWRPGLGREGGEMKGI